ncbi:uncharacterized protein LOC112488959 [Ziziphus jujuba]|uniref:Uncharacterized protein LOC112488959 n=2 Tax=Ziziphus jujuba TaxID=326968 RepID=A0A6P6FM57_ZIZJJ|nr:uncharacterized protein LOC112488959 [Ziziphus jujuba]KAH7513553.1 hypothetical protein FEM48_Zijuj12G0212400 [Ziziphus jujuba var. spinosa]
MRSIGMKRRPEESWRCSYCGDDGSGKGKDKAEEEGSGMVLLHNVQHRGRLRLLCTNCVLMNHPGLFCPICLQPFDPSSSSASTSSAIPPPPPPVGHRLMCLKCPAIAHLSCSSSSSSSSFLCPPCTSHKSPPFRFFSSSNGEGDGFLDRRNAKALVAAATIAAFSMNKAAIAARADADRLLKDALAAKKRAKQALDILAHLVAIDNHNNDNDEDKDANDT